MTGLERAYDNINKLVEFCNSKETNTTFGENGKIIHLIKDTVGKATYIYGEYGFDKDFFVHLDKKFEVVAIAADNVVYIVDTYMFSDYEITRSGKELPDGVRWLGDYYNELNEKLTNEFFPRYYENLVPTGVDSYEDSRLEELARIELLGNGEPHKGQLDRDSKVTEYDIAKLLAGFENEQEIFAECVNRSAGIYNSRKSREVATARYIAEHDVVKDYELRIAEAIRNTEAKNVVVWFEKHNKQSSAKISPQNIQRVLIRKFDYFSTYVFMNGEEAKRMFFEIGATDRGWGENQNRLTTKDIVKIMYRGKAIYQREEA
ncbi:hypothetical protein [Ruminococcus sp. YE282]|uniref:hypothetical protein n=1 Tax=Ruminococcus sp. YE282 TaxID=3158780 RepID=UPI000881CB4F|nr:hypothetical protein SAMN02910441_00178 [Ruminococcus bromii]